MRCSCFCDKWLGYTIIGPMLLCRTAEWHQPSGWTMSRDTLRNDRDEDLHAGVRGTRDGIIARLREDDALRHPRLKQHPLSVIQLAGRAGHLVPRAVGADDQI